MVVFKILGNFALVLRRHQKPHSEVLFDSLWGAIKAWVEARLQVTPATPRCDVDSAIAKAAKVAREKFEIAEEDIASAIPDLAPSVSVASSAEISGSAILSLRSHMTKIPRKSAIQGSANTAIVKTLYGARPLSSSQPSMFGGFRDMFLRCVSVICG